MCLALAERRPELVRAVLAYEAPKMWAPWWPGSSAGRGARAVARAGAGATEPVAPVTPRVSPALGPCPTSPTSPSWGRGRRVVPAAHDRAMSMWERLPATMRAERRAEGPTLVAEMRSVRPPAPVPFDAAADSGAGGGRPRLRGPAPSRAGDRGELAPAAPRGELQVIAGADHGAHLSHPVELADLVRRAAALADGRS